jgi:Tfp pilus assembly protein PilO
MPTQREKITNTLNDFYQKPVARVSLELFLSVFAVVFFAIFAIRPTLVTMSDLVKEIEDKKDLDQKLTQKIASLSTAQTSYLDVQERLYLLVQTLPSTPDLVHSVKIIEKLAVDRGVLIDSLTISALSGEYEDIRDFVQDLISYRRLFVTDTVIFSTSEERGQKKLRVNISLSIPYFGDKK